MKTLPVALLLPLLLTPARAQQPSDEARYETRFRDPVIEQLRERDRKTKDQASDETAAIRKRQKQAKDQRRREQQRLVSSLPSKKIPSSPAAFTRIAHQPPRAQFLTGTCWSFSATSMLEAEAERLGGRRVALSEMHTVYWEYVERARRFVVERGASRFTQGSEANAVPRIWARYGAVPLALYPGVGEGGQHDHQQLMREMRAVLDQVKRESLWDEDLAIALLRVVLDRHLGAPPAEFNFDGQRTTPQRFMREVLKVDPAAYVSVMSTLKQPFFRRGLFDVPDNWWRDRSYHNLPLDSFYKALHGAIAGGYGITVAIDVSEPGKDGPHDALFVPSYDIPGPYIDQAAREYRLEHQVTTDDHGVHLVGLTRHAGHDWFLIKDSGRSARRGKHRGYYFMRDDYVRLKLMAFTVHRDALAELLGRFPAQD